MFATCGDRQLSSLSWTLPAVATLAAHVVSGGSMGEIPPVRSRPHLVGALSARLLDRSPSDLGRPDAVTPAQSGRLGWARLHVMPRCRRVPNATDESAHTLDELCGQRRLACAVAFPVRTLALRARSTLRGARRRVTSHPGTRSRIGRHITGRVIRPAPEAHLAVRAAVFRTRSTFRGTCRRTALLPAQFA